MQRMCKLIVSAFTILSVFMAISTEGPAQMGLCIMTIMGMCCLALSMIAELDGSVDADCK